MIVDHVMGSGLRATFTLRAARGRSAYGVSLRG
jgi:hypothetical protein